MVKVGAIYAQILRDSLHNPSVKTFTNSEIRHKSIQGIGKNTIKDAPEDAAYRLLWMAHDLPTGTEILNSNHLIDALNGDVLVYGLESLTFGVSDTVHLPYLWNFGNLVEMQAHASDKRGLGKSLIVYTGVGWQSQNRISEEMTKQAAKVRTAIFDKYEDLVGSAQEMMSSDDLEVDLIFPKNEALTKSISNLSKNSPYGDGYTRYEFAVNRAIIDMAKEEGYSPLKISLENQGVDKALALMGPEYTIPVIRLPLPPQRNGAKVTPYSIPTNGDSNQGNYFLLGDKLHYNTDKGNPNITDVYSTIKLIGDFHESAVKSRDSAQNLIESAKKTPDELRKKLNAYIRSDSDEKKELLLPSEFFSHIIPTHLSDRSVLYEAINATTNELFRAAQSVGGYPLDEFISAIRIGEVYGKNN